MQLTLAEVVKREELSRDLNIADFTSGTSTSRDQASRTLCFIINGGDSVMNGHDSAAILLFPDGSLLRRLALEHVLPKEINGIRYDALARLLNPHKDETPSLSFEYELASADYGKFSGLRQVPEEDRRRVQDTLRTLVRYYRAREYLKESTEREGLTYGTLDTVEGDKSWNNNPKYAFFIKGKTPKSPGPHIAYLWNGTLHVTARYYLPLFREIAKTLAKDYNIVPFKVEMVKIPVEAR
ncbi:TPA: hypothetical protein HA246_06040 [Candidatus Woesearchaeota archaeon]|nr:hypothetical protein [Candidatus Woesearchaeota archaeon]